MFGDFIKEQEELEGNKNEDTLNLNDDSFNID